MAEDDAQHLKHSKSKFKSKWGRVFKEKEEHEANPKHTNSFKLNDDVVDFLKPSTDKTTSARLPQAPKIDVAIAQRWPDAHEVRRASARTPASPPILQGGWAANGATKPRRKKGLSVGFVKTAPEIIGEGGDEALDPVTEIGRLKAMVSRSVSDRRPSSREEGIAAPWSGSQEQPPPPQGSAASRQARLPNGEEEDFVPQPIRRVQTSHHELSPAMQRKHALPPLEVDPLPSRPTLNRTPTGFGSHDDMDYSPDEDYGMPGPDERFAIPKLRTQMEGPPGGGRDDLPSARSRDPEALVVRRRSMSSGEGMALRRASAMIMDEEDEEDQNQKRTSFGLGMQLPQEHYDVLARPDAPDILPQVPEHQTMQSPESITSSQGHNDPRAQDASSSTLSPLSAISPGGPSPFADPKYMKRHSKEVQPTPPPPAGAPLKAAPQSFRQQRQAYVPSYMRAAQSQASDGEQQATRDEQPSYMRTAQQQVPQVQPPARGPVEEQSPEMQQSSAAQQASSRPIGSQAQLPQRLAADLEQTQMPPPARQRADERVARDDSVPSYMKAMQPPSSDFVPTRPPPAPASSQNIAVPPDPSRNRSRSPMRDRIFDANVASDRSRFFARPNGSSTSLNHFPPSPKLGHSRSSSRDENSPDTQRSAGSGQYGQWSPRLGTFNQGSPSDNQGAFVPYPRAPNQADNYSAPRAPPSQGSSLRPTNLRAEESTSRPGSASSNASFQRGPNYFSAPRPPQNQAIISPAAQLQQEEASRPGSSDSRAEARRPPDFFSTSNAIHATPAKSTASNLRQESRQRSGSSASSTTTPQRPAISPMPPEQGNPAADAAYADFAARVAHMKGVFRLTAEKEQPADRCSPLAWLRAAIWWYHKGKAGLEVLLQQRPAGSAARELLAQPHVDLAKAWWILTDPLDAYDLLEDAGSPQSAASLGHPDLLLKHSAAMLRSHLKSLSFSMSRNQIMPPPQSLIQGQDTRIWLEYPRFTADAAAVLGGTASKGYIVDSAKQGLPPAEALPLGNTRDVFCFGRFPVEVSMTTDDADTDRVVLPCLLTMTRGKRDFQMSVVIASQTELVNVKIGPKHGGERGLSWHDVSWKASTAAMAIHLPHGFDLNVRMQDRDFRGLLNLTEYSRKVEQGLHTEQDERVVYEARLVEVQYANSSNSNSFPTDKVRSCTAIVFEHAPEHADSSGTRKMHRGYRLCLFTDPTHKSLSSVSHELCRHDPLMFEFITDAAANGMGAMVLRVRDENNQCRILLVFPDLASRQNFYDVLNGLTVGPDEAIVGKMSLTGMNIQPATQFEGFSQFAHPALRSLTWQKLGVTNTLPEDRAPSTVQSESLRVVARHANGCITDRLNLGKGEMLLRLPCADTRALQILRNPQEDMGMSIDVRNCSANITDGIAELLALVRQQPTIRTFTFASPQDLHAFQAAITGYTVRYDGLANTFSISRRMMVVPLYKKWEASRVRLQVVTAGPVTQLLAFMEDFSHTDAMCFQLKSTDVFEVVKGGGDAGKGGGKKCAVKLVDAKFSLPPAPAPAHAHGEEKADADGLALEERVGRRFVNLEGLEYAGEHDDITIGFENVDERDRFTQALPAAATVGRDITLKRRI